MCMRVLDIDLDFFLDAIPIEQAAHGDRLPSEWIPWTDKEVIKFLEGRCGLSDQKPIKGRYVEHHHEAFYYWKDLIQQDELTAPFEVVHVDAHADLGACNDTWRYLVSDVLSRKPEDRTRNLNDSQDGINCGNFLVFAVACHWLKKLTYVHHPICGDDPKDLYAYHFKDFQPKTNTLQLKSTADPDLLNDEANFQANVDRGCITLEPEVPFKAVHPDSFRDKGDFDFVVLCQSPEYTPETSDALIPVIQRYIA